MLLELVPRLEVRRAEIAQLRDELVRRVLRVVELLAERVGGDRCAAGSASDVIESRQSERLVHTSPGPLLGRLRPVVAQPHRDRGDDDRHDADHDRPR